MCCICPARRGGGRRPCTAIGPCAPTSLEILGRDIVSCYPANHHNAAAATQQERGSKKGLDMKVTGFPVFMIVAYPPNKAGKRKRMLLHFHLMQKIQHGKNKSFYCGSST